MKPILLMAIVLCLFVQPALAADEPPPTEGGNSTIRSIFEADQADRLGDAFRREPEAVLARDRSRRDQVLAMLKSGELHTADDYFFAAIVFQHSADDIELAHALATISHYLDPSNKRSSWLMAASWDRILMQHIQPQWYGTQYQGSDKGVFLFPVAENAITDAEREAAGVPLLAEARAKVPEMAKMMGQQARMNALSIEELREQAARDRASVHEADHSEEEE